MSARRNIGHAAAEFLAVVLEEIAGTLDQWTRRMDAVRPDTTPANPPPAPVPSTALCTVEVRGVPCVLPLCHTGAHIDPNGAFLAPFVTVPESDGLEAQRMAERGLTVDDRDAAEPVPFVDLGGLREDDAAAVAAGLSDAAGWGLGLPGGAAIPDGAEIPAGRDLPHPQGAWLQPLLGVGEAHATDRLPDLVEFPNPGEAAVLAAGTRLAHAEVTRREFPPECPNCGRITHTADQAADCARALDEEPF